MRSKNEFELLIENSIKHYENRMTLIGEKIIEKTLFGAKFSYGVSKFDFWILYSGMFFAVEAKSSKRDYINIKSALDLHQIDNLFSVYDNGGFGLLAVKFLSGNSNCFIADISTAIEDKSLKIERCESNLRWIKIAVVNVNILDIPSALDEILKVH